MEQAMPIQSEFVKNVHLNTVRTMLEHGIQQQQIVEHLKAVSCDEDDISALLQALNSADPYADLTSGVFRE
jgi:flagellar basal body P-ring protein FlgI